MKIAKAGFPKWGRLVEGRAIWAKWPKTTSKLQNWHFCLKTVGGAWGGQANFSGSGRGSPPVPTPPPPPLRETQQGVLLGMDYFALQNQDLAQGFL